MSRILVVDDSEECFQLIANTLGPTTETVWAKNVNDALNLVEKKTYDLILLDVMLPDGDGYNVCSMVRSNDKTRGLPIIFLTAKDSVNDKVLGFSLGADDFVTKPFEPMEFRARISARMRKRQREQTEAEILDFGEVLINMRAQKAFVVEDGKKRDINLTPMEFKLLSCLAQSQDKLFSRNQLLDTLWGTEVNVYDRSVDTHISKIRKKLGNKSTVIQSVHRSGYRFSNPQPVIPPKPETQLAASH
ncbi:MAG: response regulator transcription factor [Bdellovibrionia bacterium]